MTLRWGVTEKWKLMIVCFCCVIRQKSLTAPPHCSLTTQSTTHACENELNTIIYKSGDTEISADKVKRLISLELNTCSSILMDNMRCIRFPLWCNNDVEFIHAGMCCWLCGQTAVWRSSERLLHDHTTKTYNHQLSPPASQSLLTSPATAWKTTDC